MKKKIVLVALIAAITTGAAFAEYPKGWGVGLVAGYGGFWEEGFDNGTNWGLSLKAPQVPIFWGIDLELNKWYTLIGVRGDYYLIHKALIKEINLDWYFGVGGWFSTLIPKEGDMWLSLGARAPIGLSWQPVDILEIFLEIAPSIGVRVTPEFHFPSGGWGAGIGFRIWF